MPVHYLNQQGTVNLSAQQCKALLVSDWRQRQHHGRGFRHLLSEDLYTEVDAWLNKMEGRMPYQVVLFCRTHRRRLPRRFSDDDKRMYATWREAQFQMEGIERGEQLVVDQEQQRQVHDWKKFVDPEMLSRLVPSAQQAEE